MKACCSGCSAPSFARPSIVVISAPCFMTASVRQELILLPSTNTVHAPHWPWSQPFLVPVRSRWSRSASRSVVHGASLSCLATPFTVMATESFSGTATISSGGLVRVILISAWRGVPRHRQVWREDDLRAGQRSCTCALDFSAHVLLIGRARQPRSDIEHYAA